MPKSDLNNSSNLNTLPLFNVHAWHYIDEANMNIKDES